MSSWVCLRGQVLDSTRPSEAAATTEEWCAGAGDWGDNGNNIEDIDDDLNNRISHLNVETVCPTETKALSTATAEIEDNGEGDMILVEAPLTAQTDIYTLLNQVPQVCFSLFNMSLEWIDTILDLLS